MKRLRSLLMALGLLCCAGVVHAQTVPAGEVPDVSMPAPPAVPQGGDTSGDTTTKAWTIETTVIYRNMVGNDPRIVPFSSSYHGSGESCTLVASWLDQRRAAGNNGRVSSMSICVPGEE